LTEQYDPRAGVALGNVAQTYSHHGIIDMAVRLDALRTPGAAARRRPWARLRAQSHRRHTG